MASDQNLNDQPWWKKHQALIAVIGTIATLIGLVITKNIGDITIWGDKTMGDKTMGDKIVNTYKSRPDYWIETEDKHRLKPGDSMDVEVIADPISHLDNTSCEWSFKTDDEEGVLAETIRFEQDKNNSCAGTISLPEAAAALIPISTAITLSAKVAVHKDGEVYRKTRPIPISHDTSSPASLTEIKRQAIEPAIEKEMANMRAKLTVDDGHLSPEDEKFLEETEIKLRKAFK